MNPDLFRVVIAHAVSQACMTGLRVALPVYALANGLGAASAGVLLGCFSASNLVLSVPIGRMVDRKGLHGPWQFSVWLAVLGALLCALVPNLWGLGLAAMLVGTSVAVSQLAAQHYGSGMVRTSLERTEVMAWLMLAPAVATLVGPVGVGLLLDHAGRAPTDYRSLVAVSAMVALLAVASRFLVRPVAEARQPVARADRPASGGRWALLRTPGVVMVMALNALIAACWTAFLLIVPILAHDRGLSASTVGTIFGAFALASALVRPLLPRLAANVPHRALVVASCLLSAVALVGFPLTRSTWLYLLCATAYGLAMGGVQVLLMAALTEIVPKPLQGEALGVRLLMFSAANLIVPMILGVVGSVMGVGAIFTVAAAVAVATALLALRMRTEAVAAINEPPGKPCNTTT